MYDRIPSPGKENRVRITQDNGQIVEGVLAYADDATQEGSAYTKGNVLPDRVLSLIGLPTDPSEPADMFNVLATVGDLYVWRRTQLRGGESAKYELAEPVVATLASGSETNVYEYGDSVSVSESGEVSLNKTGQISISPQQTNNAQTIFPGKFIKSLLTGRIYFIPLDAIILASGSTVNVDKMQRVFGIPAVPPGTYIDYPVSVNPNAYQTGSDAKPAGYTLGEVQSGQFVLSQDRGPGYGSYYEVSNTINVENDGTISLVSAEFIDLGQISSAVNITGKFIELNNIGNSDDIDFVYGNVFFIPEDASITVNGTVERDVVVDKRQPVTGYPAIPASTTIEYLGKLGDKSRMQIVSYVGTGTYGSGNKTVVSFDFAPSIIFIFGSAERDNVDFGIFVNGFSVSSAFLPNTNANSVYPRTNNVTLYSGELSFYNIGDARSQLNANGKKYTAIGFA